MIRRMHSTDRYPPGRMMSWELSSDKKALRVRFEAATVEITVDRHSTVRLRASGGVDLGPDLGTAICRNPLNTVPLRVQELEGKCTLVVAPFRNRSDKRSMGSSLIVVVDGARGRIEARLDGSNQKRISAGSLGRIWGLDLLEFSSGGAASAAVVTDIYSRYWGFGEKTGPLDKRGQFYTMRTRDMPVTKNLDPLYAAIPFFMWSRPAWQIFESRTKKGPAANGWELPRITLGCLLECFAPSTFDISRAYEDRVVISTAYWGLDLTFFMGPSPKEVLNRYLARTGLPPMPPLWALGYHQSRWSYENEAEVLRVAQEFANRGIPLDVIHLDIDYMDNYKVFTWNKRSFPNPNNMARRLGEMGIRLVAIVDPGVKVEKGYDVFDEGRRRGVFCRRDDGELFTMWVWPRKAAFVDFNDEEGRSFWGGLHERLFNSGISGIWNDMNEPAGWRLDARISKLILPLVPQDTSRMRQADPTDPDGKVIEHEAVRNIYAYQECRALAEHIEKSRPGQRHFILTRSGYAGIQRFAAMWTGDTASMWDHLSLSVRMLLGLSMSGVGFCGADIGGFLGRPSKELFARWIQVGSVYPFSRTHSQGIWGRQEPYSFGPDVERISKDYISMRMRLLAYIYGLFAEYSREGFPPWRAVFVEFPEAAEAYEIEDQIMLGRTLLVAPVTSKRSRSRTVYFPPGEWIALGSDLMPWGADRYLGASRYSVRAPLEWMPVFIRAGCVLPVLWPAKSTVEILGENDQVAGVTERELVMKTFCFSSRYFAGVGESEVAKEVSQYYEDDFMSTDYRDGMYALYPIRFEQRQLAKDRMALSIVVSEKQGTYAPRIAPLVWEIWCPPFFEPSSVRIDGEDVEWTYRLPSTAVLLRTEGPIRPCNIEVIFTPRRAL